MPRTIPADVPRGADSVRNPVCFPFGIALVETAQCVRIQVIEHNRHVLRIGIQGVTDISNYLRKVGSRPVCPDAAQSASSLRFCNHEHSRSSPAFIF